MTPKQQAMAEALGLIAAQVPVPNDQVPQVAAILDRLYEQAKSSG